MNTSTLISELRSISMITLSALLAYLMSVVSLASAQEVELSAESASVEGVEAAPSDATTDEPIATPIVPLEMTKIPRDLQAIILRPELSETEVELLFTHGRNAYSFGSYQEVVWTLERIITPRVLINDSHQLEEVYKLLGLAYFYLGHLERARRSLRDLIYLNPKHTLDAARVPPAALSLINKLRVELQSKLEQRRRALAQQEALNQQRELERSRRFVVLEQQVNQRLIALVPFGAGQFQNHDTGWGYLFLASEVIAIGMSAGFFWGVESLRQSDGRYRRGDYQLALQMQRAQVISGGVAIGLMVSGIAHALWNFKPRYNLGNHLDSNPRYDDEVILDDDFTRVELESDEPDEFNEDSQRGERDEINEVLRD